MRLATGFTTVVPMLFLAACATGGSSRATSDPAGDATRPRVARNALSGPITAAEIARTNAASAYDAVKRLRANYLQSRGIGSFVHATRSAYPVVFIDGMEIGTLFELRSIPAQDVLEIRLLSSGEATLRYGQGYTAGIIHVTTKR